MNSKMGRNELNISWRGCKIEMSSERAFLIDLRGFHPNLAIDCPELKFIPKWAGLSDYKKI